MLSIFMVAVGVKPSRGRGHGRGIRKQNNQHTRSGSAGSSTSNTPCPGHSSLVSHENIPFAARIPVDEGKCNTLWVNQHGQRRQREVSGSRVLIRQQPAAPPTQPEILLLSDEMLSHMSINDKYFKCVIMYGYSFQNYVQDIQDQLIDVDIPYVLVFIGSLQLGIFHPDKVNEEVSVLMQEINAINNTSLVVFSGVVPRPLDHHRSRNCCINYNSVLQSTVEKLRKQDNYNCAYVDVYGEFLDHKHNICDVRKNFVEELYLSEAGVRIACSAWLRYLGFFPKKH